MPIVDDIVGLRRILTQRRTIAVVGLSAQWHRPSYFAAKYMQDHGYRIIPVNPNYGEVLGQRCYPGIADVPEQVGIVDCFRKASEMVPIARDAVAIGAKVLWMQLGIRNDEAAGIAADAGLDVVMDHCVKIEYARIMGGLAAGRSGFGLEPAGNRGRCQAGSAGRNSAELANLACQGRGRGAVHGADSANRGGMEAVASRAPVCGAAQGGHRTALLERAERRKAGRCIRLRRLYAAAVYLADEIRKRHRLAELFYQHSGSSRDQTGPPAHIAADGVSLHTLRRASGTCF